jgi:hypothetical protein
MLNEPAIPNVALVASWKEVPFTATLNKLAVPLRTDVPLKVVVPADAVSVPLTFNKEVNGKMNGGGNRSCNPKRAESFGACSRNSTGCTGHFCCPCIGKRTADGKITAYSDIAC